MIRVLLRSQRKSFLWGLSTKNDPEDNKDHENEILPETYNWVASMYYLAKSMDKSRLIEDNSTCCGGLHTATDINSWHVYLPGYDWENYLQYQTEKNFKGSRIEIQRKITKFVFSILNKYLE